MPLVWTHTKILMAIDYCIYYFSVMATYQTSLAFLLLKPQTKPDMCTVPFVFSHCMKFIP